MKRDGLLLRAQLLMIFALWRQARETGDVSRETSPNREQP